MRTIQTLIDEGNAIRGVAVQINTWINQFRGEVSHQDEDGLIVAEGRDFYGPRKVKGPAREFVVV